MKTRWLIGCLAALITTNARANPFNMQQGEGRIIIDGIYPDRPNQYDDSGHIVHLQDYTQYDIYAVGEYGLTDKINILVTPSFRSVDVQNPSSHSTGLGYTVGLHVRKKFSDIGGQLSFSHWRRSE